MTVWVGTQFNGRTCAVTNGSAVVTVTGNLTPDLGGYADPGAFGLGFLGPDERIYAIASAITYSSGSNTTTFTLARNYVGTTVISGGRFDILPFQGLSALASYRLNSLINGLAGMRNAVSYGADITGVADSTAAFNAMGALGGAFYLPNGTYKINSALTFLTPIQFYGDSNPYSGTPAVVLNFTAADSADRITFGNTSLDRYGFWLENLRIEAPNATGGSLVVFERGAQSGMRNVKITNINLAARGVTVHWCNTIILDDLRIINPTTSGVYAYGNDSNRTDIIDITRLVVGGDSTGARTHMPNAIEINGNIQTVTGSSIYAVGCNRGFYRHNTIAATVRGEFDTFHALQVDYPDKEGVRYDYGDGGWFDDLYVHGSLAESGIYLAYASAVNTNFTFKGGSSTGNYKHGMFIDARYVNVLGMRISANSQSGSATYDGVNLGANSYMVNINNNTIGQTVGMASELQRYGVNITSGALYYNVTNNNLTNNVTGPLNDAGSGLSNSGGMTSPNIGQFTRTSFTVYDPSASGTSYTMLKDRELLVFQATTVSTFTITLPLNPSHHQEALIYSFTQITSLTVNANTSDTISTAMPAVTMMPAGGTLEYVYDRPSRSWYPRIHHGIVGQNTATWDPASIANGAQASTTITVTSSLVGQRVEARGSIALSGLQMWGEVTTNGTVTVYLQNTTGGSVDLGSMTVTATVYRN